MIILFLTTSILLLASYSLNRQRKIEVLLITPFALGSFLLPLLDIVYFLEIRDGHMILSLFLSFEWTLLTIMGLFFDSRNPYYPSSTQKYTHVAAIGVYLHWLTLATIVILITYIIGVGSQIFSSPNVADYFIQKRVLAHAGEGIDQTNPLAYRAINYSMALVLLLASYKFYSRNDHLKSYKIIFFTLLSVGGFASLLEGNRSTLIVTLVALMSSYYLNNSINRKKFIWIITSFILAFVFSMQILRLEGDYSLSGLKTAFSWFIIYAFGSTSSFADFYSQNVQTFWYTFDIAAQKFGQDFSKAIGAREFFIIDYVNIGDLSTNVYSGYAVLFDYLGVWAAPFLLSKCIVFYIFKSISKRSIIGNACYMAQLASFPLTIYHEFWLTTMFYSFNIFLIAVIFWAFFSMRKFIIWMTQKRSDVCISLNVIR